MDFILLGFFGYWFIHLLVKDFKSQYLITYYQQRLKNNGLIDTVKNMTLIEMLRS